MCMFFMSPLFSSVSYHAYLCSSVYSVSLFCRYSKDFLLSQNLSNLAMLCANLKNSHNLKVESYVLFDGNI